MSIEEDCRLLRPVIGDKAVALYETWLAEDRDGRLELEQAAQALVHRLVHNRVLEPAVLLPPPRPGLLDGPFRLGVVHYNGRDYGPFGLREHEAVAHVLIGGMTGAGKSTLLALVILQHLRQRRPVWVFDFKRDYRHLLQYPQASGLRVLTVAREVAPFAFNPLTPPPGVDVEQWDHVLVESMTHAFFGGEGVESLLYRALEQTREDVRDRLPTFRDLADRVHALSLRGRAALWQDSTIRALASLCRGRLGKAINTQAPHDLLALMEDAVVFEMDTLDTPTRTFLAQVLIMFVTTYRAANNQRGTWRLTIITDEAHSLFLARQQSAPRRETHLDLALRTARDGGTSLWLADQCPSLLSRVALGNTYLTMALNLKYRDDVNAMSSALLLNERAGERDYLGQLPVGQAVCRMASRYHQPFLIRIPDIPLNKTHTTDHHLHQHYNQKPPSRAHSAHSATSPPPFAPPSPLPPLPPPDNNLDPDSAALLADIRHHPLDPLTVRYARLGLSARKGTHAATHLETTGLVTKGTIQQGTTRLTILTPNEHHGSKGSTEHEYWTTHTKALLESDGWTVTREHPIGNGRADLYATKNAQSIPIEIETGKSDWKHNLHRIIQAGFTQALIIATNTPAHAAITAETCQLPIDVRVIDASKNQPRRNPP